MALFYEFSLDAQVPTDQLVRALDRAVDLGGVRQHLEPCYSPIGRPSVDPELMIRMLTDHVLAGWASTARSLIIRRSPRTGMAADLLRHVFGTTVQRCRDQGLVGGEDSAVNGSLSRADAIGRNGIPAAAGLPADTSPSRAVREYLAVLADAAFGAATEVPPNFVSPSDPAARWTAAHGGPGVFA